LKSAVKLDNIDEYLLAIRFASETKFKN